MLDDIPQIDEIDIVLDDLSSPTSLEVFEALLPFEDEMSTAAIGAIALTGGGGGPPTGAAGGVLGGTYPNPGFAADMATQAELDALSAQAVILAPASSARNVIQPTAGDVIAAVLKAHAAQSVDIFNVQKSDGGKYLRVGASGAVGIGEGTYDPAAYSAYLTGLVLFRADDGYYDAAVGVPFTPGADESVIGFMTDIVIRPTAGGANTEHFGVGGSMRYMGDKTAATVVAGYNEAVFLGTKAAGSGAQVERLSGNYMVAYSDASSTGDITNAYGYNGTFIHRGSGLVAALTGGYFSADALNNSGIPTVIRGVHGRAAVAALGGTVPEMAGVRAEIFAQGRAVTLAKGLDVPNAGGAGIVTSYGLYMAAQSGSTNVYGAYVAGGKSVFVDTLITGKIALPADADFANGQGGWWWDQANSLPKWKGKTSGGGVVNFEPYGVGGTDVAVADGGTGASTAAGARTNLGLVIGTDVPAFSVSVNTQTASYGLVLADAGKVVEMNVGSGNNLTVPLDATQAFAVGTVIELHQYGAGQTTVVATGGVTIRSPGGKLKLTGQYSSASLRKRATDEWTLAGDLAA